jgi:hypothetical protein
MVLLRPVRPANRRHPLRRRRHRSFRLSQAATAIAIFQQASIEQPLQGRPHARAAFTDRLTQPPIADVGESRMATSCG